MPVDFKHQILDTCIRLIGQRIEHAKKAIESSQEAANSNEKSSAGDKYETSRAMGQLDRDMNAKQLVQARNELDLLLKINPTSKSERIIPGSLVKSTTEIYFVGAGLGVIEVNKKKVIALSLQAPLAKAIAGKKANDQITFNGKTLSIISVE